MASAVILTYERKSSLNRSASMKKPHHASNAFSMDSTLPDRSYTFETVGDSSDIKRSRRPSDFPCTAQNFSSRSKEPPHETGSDDSTSFKRKSISINGKLTKEGRLGSGALLRDLSRDEKRELRTRIKKELQQVRSITQKLEAREYEVRSYVQPLGRSDARGMDSNGHYMPATAESSFQEAERFSKWRSSEFHDANGERMNGSGKDKSKLNPKGGHHNVNSEFLSGKDSKLLLSDKSKVKGSANVKRGLNGRFESREPKKQKMGPSGNKKINEIMKQCSFLLSKIMTHKFGWVFNEPVDAVKLNLHDYHKIIKKPMDLGTVKKKLGTRAYSFPSEFCEDVRLTFSNAMTYNPQGHDVYHMAEVLKGLFESKWKTLEDKVKVLEYSMDQTVFDEEQEPRSSHLPSEQVRPLPSALPKPVSMPPVKKPKQPAPARSSSKAKGKPVIVHKRPMTYDEKQKLSELLGTLTADKLERAVQIMKKNPNLTQTDDEIEVDIESFDIDTLWELHHFVMECSNASYDEPVQAQAVSVSEVSDKVMKMPDVAERVNEHCEEEIDIGDDMPTKEFPPVVIEKDKVASHATKSSSSSSSSGSGSSSSDSESGSSSGSESEADDARSPEAVSKVSTVDKDL